MLSHFRVRILNAGVVLPGWVRRVPHLLRRGLPPSYDLASAVDAARLELNHAMRGSEREFLELGERLGGFHRDAGAISRQASAVAEVLTGKELAAITGGFREIGLWTEDRERVAGRGTERFLDVLGLLERMGAEIGRFQTIVRTLDMLCVSTRIECARLAEGDMGFHTIAGDVRKLAREVESRCEALMNKRTSLAALIETSLAYTRELEEGRRSRIEGIIEGTRASLETLASRRENASAGARRVADRYAAISVNIGEVVGSLQFHDITRQRIEHAEQALAGLRAEGAVPVPEPGAGGSGGRGNGDGRLERARRWFAARAGERWSRLEMAGDICELQAAQLDQAREEVVSAIRNVTGNLSDIAAHVRGITADSSVLSGSEEQAGEGSLRDISEALEGVAEALSGYARADESLVDSIRSVGSTLAEMSTFAEGIASIGIKVQLIALNAVVKACHMGDRGASLGILAEAIHALSNETRTRTANMDEILGSIGVAAAALSGGSETDTSGEEGMEGVMAHLRAMREALPGLNERVVELVGRMRTEGESLAEAIDDALSGVTVQDLFDRALGKAAAKLLEVTAASRAGEGASPERRAARLEALESLYTMRQERNVHEMVAGMTPSVLGPANGEGGETVELWGDDGTEPAPPGTGKDTEEDLGDNVELF